MEKGSSKKCFLEGGWIAAFLFLSLLISQGFWLPYTSFFSKPAKEKASCINSESQNTRAPIPEEPADLKLESKLPFLDPPNKEYVTREKCKENVYREARALRTLIEHEPHSLQGSLKKRIGILRVYYEFINDLEARALECCKVQKCEDCCVKDLKKGSEDLKRRTKENLK